MTIQCKKCGQEFKQMTYYRRHINKKMCIRNEERDKNENASKHKNKESVLIFRNELMQILKKMDTINTTGLVLDQLCLSFDSKKTKSKIIVIEK